VTISALPAGDRQPPEGHKKSVANRVSGQKDSWCGAKKELCEPSLRVWTGEPEPTRLDTPIGFGDDGKDAPVGLPDLLSLFLSTSFIGSAPYRQRTANTVGNFLMSSQAETENLEEIFSPMQLRRHIRGLLDAGRSARTIRSHLSYLSGFCQFLIENGNLADNPCAKIKPPALERTAPVWLSDTECNELLRISRNAWIGPAIGLVLYTGIRVAELSRLEWRDVDFQGKTLMVRKSKSKRFRLVPLCRRAIVFLRWQRRKTGRFRWVCCARQGVRGGSFYVDRQASTTGLSTAFRPIRDQIPKFRELPDGTTGRAWHMLRHTFATRLAQRKAWPGNIQRFLGHSDYRMTERYIHLAQGYDADIEKLD